MCLDHLHLFVVRQYFLALRPSELGVMARESRKESTHIDIMIALSTFHAMLKFAGMLPSRTRDKDCVAPSVTGSVHAAEINDARTCITLAVVLPFFLSDKQ